MPARTSPAGANRRYLIRFVVIMAGYVILLPVALVLVHRVGGSPWRFAIVLVPVIPFAVLGWAVWRLMVETDELQRRIQLEALAVAFAAGSVITFGYGMLQVAGAPRISWLFVWPVYAGCWLVGGFVAKWRYR